MQSNDKASKVSADTAYLIVDADALTAWCKKIYRESAEKDTLIRVGTLPEQDRYRLYKLLDPANVDSPYSHRFEKGVVMLQSWTEYFSLACAAHYLNYKWKDIRIAYPQGSPLKNFVFKPVVGLESAYVGDERGSEEKLGDGLLMLYPPKLSILSKNVNCRILSDWENVVDLMKKL